MINLHIRRRIFETKVGPDKALCYFQPILQVGATVGTASFNEIRTAANALLSQCAKNQGQGGIATGIGMSFVKPEPFGRVKQWFGSSPSDWTLMFDRRRWQPRSHSRHLLTKYSMLRNLTQMDFLQGDHEYYGCHLNECNLRTSPRPQYPSQPSRYTFIK